MLGAALDELLGVEGVGVHSAAEVEPSCGVGGKPQAALDILLGGDVAGHSQAHGRRSLLNRPEWGQ